MSQNPFFYNEKKWKLKDLDKIEIFFNSQKFRKGRFFFFFFLQAFASKIFFKKIHIKTF